MADKTTFIKLDRNIINWRWYGNPKILSVFIWLIIKANIKTGHFQRDIIERGSIATSNAHIAEGCNLTIDNVRTALANLEHTGEITRISRNHYQIITIVNYEAYQTDIRKTEHQIPSNTDGKSQATAIANPNNQRIYKNKRMERKKEETLRSDSPLGIPKRGTDEFRAKSHIYLQEDEGTLDDIPLRYRDMFNNFQEYWRYKNQ